MQSFKIGERPVGPGEPAYFIAEVGSNFDGDLDRAFRLVDLAREAGADAVKFQTFAAERIVSAHSFRDLQVGFQSSWGKDVHTVYREAEFPREWHEDVLDYASKRNLAFFSSPYDRDAVDLLDDLNVPAFKIGSGDIDWLDMIRYTGSKGKPVLISTGAANLDEVDRAVRTLREAGCEEVCLMQCITNYPSHFEHANVRVLKTYARAFPDVLLGYSDHTQGDVVPLAAVTLGARVIEKHFTDDRTRDGPDHPHSMEPEDFRAMVDRVRNLEKALGSTAKRVTAEEEQTRIIQRRSLHTARAVKAGESLTKDDIVALRPAVGISLDDREAVVGRTAKQDLAEGEALTWDKLE